jgi:uncharacterized protein (TIGR03118 family)
MKRIRLALSAVMSVMLVVGVVACNGDSLTAPPQYKTTVLVSDGSVPAAHVDPNLKNPWGVAFNPMGFVWISDNGTQRATLYDGNGVPQSLVVTIPAGTSGPSNPTGVVFNGTTDFVVSQAGKSGVGVFIFAGEAGTLTAWSPAVNATQAVTMFDDGSGGAVYKGLALASNNGANFLFAADFHNNKIDVFDRSFTKVTIAGAFQDPALPAGFAPFGIQAIGSKLYVTYAKQDGDAHDDVKGPGLGFVNVFDTAGRMIQRFASGGPLNAPWGAAMAPSNFARFAHDILIGNFGDGTINAFNANTGMFDGTLQRNDGTQIVEDGLWGIAFGNGLNNQPTNTLFFAAGPNDEANGVYGRIDVDQ